MNSQKKERWKFAHLAWTMPLMSLLIVFGSNMLGRAFISTEIGNLLGYLMCGFVLIGCIFTFLCFVNSSKYCNTTRHAIGGLIVFFIFIIIMLLIQIYIRRGIRARQHSSSQVKFEQKKL